MTLSVSPQVVALKQLRADLAAAPWPILPLGHPEVAEINPKVDLKSLDADAPVSFLPMEAVDENTNTFHPTVRPVGEVRKGYTAFADNDVIWAKITPCMQNGKSAIVRGLANGLGSGSTEFHVLRAGTRALPEFLWAILSMPRMLFSAQGAFTGSSGHQRVPASFLANLDVPVPSLLDQERMVAALLDAKRSAETRKVDSEDTLRGIDQFVLAALGINPSGGVRNVFAVTRQDVGRRLDADYNSPLFARLRNAISNASFDTSELANVCKPLRSGFAAGAKDQARDGVASIPHLRPLNLNGFGELTLEGTKSVPLDAVSEADLIVNGEVLFNNTNSAEWVGKTAVFDLDADCACSNHMTRIIPSDRIDPYYLAALLNALRGLGYFKALSTYFNNQAGINASTLGELRIPIPPMDIQRQIAEEVQQRKHKARRLQDEASKTWQAARQRFEDQLLNGVAS
jgi:type I restriction enzyme, S subunit